MLAACLLAAACLGALAPDPLVPGAAAETNGLAPTPPMGWNDWYSAYCGVNAQLVEQTAQAMVSDGLKAAGYDYVNIDDCWMAASRDGAGNLVADPGKFPDGIAPVAEFVHGLGLKLGIYEDAGTITCAHLPGSFGHEAQDAAAFASWGVDYVKYDRCNIPYANFPGQTEQQVQQTLYTRMSTALAATGRPIVFSMCNPDRGDDPWAWSGPIANLWRTTTDIQDNFGSMLLNFEGTVDLFADAHPGAWNDPDLLQIGNGGSSLTEYRSEFSLWAEMAAPLIASTHIAGLSPGALGIYENRNVIAVDQDPLGAPGVPVSRTSGLWVLAKRLQNGDRAVVLFNSTDTASGIATTVRAVGLPAARAYRLQDLWTGAVSETGRSIRAFVPPHGVVMYRVGPASRPRGLPPQIVLSLTPAASAVNLAGSTTIKETFDNDGVFAVKGLALSLRAAHGWQVKRRGRARIAHLAAGRRFTVTYRVKAPSAGPPVTLANLVGRARYDPPHEVLGSVSASLGERVFAPVPAPFETADTTNHAAQFGARDGAFAISARGTGVLQPVNAPPLDSYAAIYERQRAGPSSTVQVTVSSGPAGGAAGGAGLIERDAMSAPAGSPAGVVLFVNGSGTVVMAWNASGGRAVDSRATVPNVIVRTPVSLRLVRSGNTYTGYYSRTQGLSWMPVGTVAVAPAASAGNQDVGVFHASGLPTWTTTATFAGLSIT